jgi:hypothetical protein
MKAWPSDPFSGFSLIDKDLARSFCLFAPVVAGSEYEKLISRIREPSGDENGRQAKKPELRAGSIEIVTDRERAYP